MRQLSVRHHREGRWGIEGAQPHIHILEGESCLQTRVIKVLRHIGVVLHQRLHLQEKGDIARLEKIAGFAEIRINQFLDAQLIVAATFIHVALETLKAALLEGFQLISQALHIRCQPELAAIIEDEMISRVDGQQVQRFVQGGAQGRKLFFVKQAHDHQGRACVEVMPIVADAVTPPSSLVVFINHGYL